MTTPGVTIIAEPGKREIVITRVFDAPRELVLKARHGEVAVGEKR